MHPLQGTSRKAGKFVMPVREVWLQLENQGTVLVACILGGGT